MINKLLVILGLILAITLPFFFVQKEPELKSDADETVVILTPHNEAVRYEFTQGFQNWYRKKTGKTVFLDWRVLGGTQEIVRYINSLYSHAFRNYWENILGKEWSERVGELCVSNDIQLPENSEEDTEEQAIRRAFLEANITCGVDLLFGGGELEIKEQLERGQLAQCSLVENHPEIFNNDVFPQKFAGVDFYDPLGYWIGATHSGFGIIYNRDVLKELAYPGEPNKWSDLTDEKFFGEVALADPTVSSSSNRAFEMILQQEMQTEYEVHGNEDLSIANGWLRGIKLIQFISANARYFTDSSTKPVLDVSAGDCAVGMSIDFYGLYQEENLKNRSESKRFGFVMPAGGSVPTADGVAMLRGAPNAEVAEAFMEYVVSVEGQKLWAFKVNAPGGPLRYALRRPPVRKDIYAKRYWRYRSNPELNIYKDIGHFVYRPQWTVPLFNVLRFSIKSAFVDPHEELVAARRAVIQAKLEGRTDAAQKALEIIKDLHLLEYSEALGKIKSTLEGGDPLKVIQLQAFLTGEFVKQYNHAKAVALGLE